MDTKGSIRDTSVRILPSVKLLEFVSNLKYQNTMPTTIASFVKKDKTTLENSHVKSKQVTETKSKSYLTTEDFETLKKIVKKTDIPSETNTIYKSTDSDVTESISDELVQDKKIQNKVDDSDCNDKQYLYLDDLEWINSYLEEVRNDGESIYLHELLEGCDIVLPENETIKRNPILEARCEKLRREQMNKAYRAMTKGVDNVRVRLPEDTIAYQIKHLNKQLIAVGQFLISIFAGFLFGFTGVELMIGGLDFGFRLLLGVMCALIIALAEIYFLAKKLNEEQIISEDVQLGGPAVFPNLPKLHND